MWKDHFTFSHFRNKDGVEVDIVLERSGHEVAGIEVKSGATVKASDFRGLRKLKDLAGDSFVCGVVLCNGDTVAGFGSGMYAVPVRALWET